MSSNDITETLYSYLPFLFFISSLPGRYRRTGPRSSGLGHPAHGGIKRFPSPLGHAPYGDLQKLFFKTFSFDNFL